MRRSGGWPDLVAWFFCCLYYIGGVKGLAVDWSLACALEAQLMLCIGVGGRRKQFSRYGFAFTPAFGTVGTPGGLG